MTAANAIAAACASAGLDLAARLRAGDYNRRVAPAHRIEDCGDPDTLVLVIGNTRRLWPAFVAALRVEPARVEDHAPLDVFVEEIVRAAVAGVTDAVVRYAHRAEPAHLSFQLLAEVSGLAWRSPAHLSVHARYGPWIALRAAVVLPGSQASHNPASRRTCFHCPHGCEKRLAQLAPQTAGWRDWLSVREACPLGREYRYSREQSAYHYTKSRDLLRGLARSG